MKRLRGQASLEFLMVLGVSAVLVTAGLHILSVVKDTAQAAFALASAKQLAVRLSYACDRALFTNASAVVEVKALPSLEGRTTQGALVFSTESSKISQQSSCAFSGRVSGSGVFRVTPVAGKALVAFNPN